MNQYYTRFKSPVADIFKFNSEISSFGDGDKRAFYAFNGAKTSPFYFLFWSVIQILSLKSFAWLNKWGILPSCKSKVILLMARPAYWAAFPLSTLTPVATKESCSSNNSECCTALCKTCFFFFPSEAPVKVIITSVLSHCQGLRISSIFRGKMFLLLSNILFETVKLTNDSKDYPLTLLC